VKVVADTLGVARSNLIAQMQRPPKQRGPYRRQGDDELLQAIRQLTDARPAHRVLLLLEHPLPVRQQFPLVRSPQRKFRPFVWIAPTTFSLAKLDRLPGPSGLSQAACMASPLRRIALRRNV
jgi:hypothetical protein